MSTDRIAHLTPKQRELVRAVVLNNVERTVRLIKEMNVDECLYDDIHILSEPFPLYYITLCNYTIWCNVDEWKDKAWAQSNKSKTLDMLRYWREHAFIDNNKRIDYQIYHYHIFGEDPAYTDEMILDSPKSDYINAGSREIDIDLFCAVLRIDFDKVKQLLLGGASPNQDLYHKSKEEHDEFEEPDNILAYLSTHRAFKKSEYSYSLRLAQGGEEWLIGEQMIEDMLDIAACNDMYSLLTNYAKQDHLDALKKALFYNNFERVTALVESSLFSDELLVDCGDFDKVGAKVPVYYITQLWNELLSGDWGACQDEVNNQKVGLNKITAYLKEKFGIDATLPMNVAEVKDIDRDYIGYTTVDDIWGADDDVKTRVKAIDLELYCAASRFDFAASERLLASGADPTVCVEENDSHSSIYEYMYDDLQERDWWQAATLHPNPDYEERRFDQMMIYGMIGSVLKQRMFDLFNKYRTRKE